MGRLSDEVDPEAVVNLRRAVDAHRDGRAMIRAGIEQHAVGLHADAAGVPQFRSQSREQRRELCGTHEERSEVGTHAGLDLRAQPLRLIPPSVIAHVIDVAVVAIQIAAARDLDEDRIDVHRLGRSGYRLWRLNVRL